MAAPTLGTVSFSITPVTGAGSGAGAGSADKAEAETKRARKAPGLGLGLGLSLGLVGAGDSEKLDVCMAADDLPVLVSNGLYVGSIRAAFNEEGLRTAGITHILNASGVEDTYPGSFKYMAVAMRDATTQDLLKVMEKVGAFLNSGTRDGNRTLVHCRAGRSRSPAIVVAFLMAQHGLSFTEARALLHKVRPTECINAGFEAQLQALEASRCNIEAARRMLVLRNGAWAVNRDSPRESGSRRALFRRMETT